MLHICSSRYTLFKLCPKVQHGMTLGTTIRCTVGHFTFSSYHTLYRGSLYLLLLPYVVPWATLPSPLTIRCTLGHFTFSSLNVICTHISEAMLRQKVYFSCQIQLPHFTANQTAQHAMLFTQNTGTQTDPQHSTFRHYKYRPVERSQSRCHKTKRLCSILLNISNRRLAWSVRADKHRNSVGLQFKMHRPVT